MPPIDLPYTPVLLERIRAVHRSLTSHGYQHAFGGAIALGVYAEPRFTADIDVNVIADAAHPEGLLAALPAGVEVLDGISAEIRRRRQARLYWSEPRTPLDLFLPQHPTFHQLVVDRAVPAPFLDTDLKVISATDLMVFKMLFDRRRDWADIAAMVEAGAGDPEDAAAWVVAIVGGEDHRLGELRRILQEHQQSTGPRSFPAPSPASVDRATDEAERPDGHEEPP